MKNKRVNDSLAKQISSNGLINEKHSYVAILLYIVGFVAGR